VAAWRTTSKGFCADLLQEEWSVTRIGAHRLHDDWANDSAIHELATEGLSSVAATVDSVLALLGVVAEE
jgi:hypothetical protein